MCKLQLVVPSMEYGAEILSFRKELMEARDKDAFAGCGSLRSCASTAEWLALLERYRSAATCPPGYAPSDTYLAVRRSDHRIVGMIDLRHHIETPVLRLWGGHIGYSVRPSERGKGYAKEMLHLHLANCKKRGLSKVMVTCSADNLHSERVILANGGILESTVVVDGEPIRRYWIAL